jgi:hypothetical protein
VSPQASKHNAPVLIALTRTKQNNNPQDKKKKNYNQAFLTMMEDDQSVEVENRAPDVEVPDEPATGETSQGTGMSVGVGKYKVHISDVQLPLIGTFFAAVVLLIAACVAAKGLKYYEYTIAVAAVAMVFSFLGLVLTFMEGDLNTKIAKYNNYFLLLWNFIGACFITFSSPFTSTGNGYFASWGLVIFSLMSVEISVESMKSAVSGMGSLLGLGASAIVVIIATASELGNDTFWKNETIYALTVACVTVIVIGALVATTEQVAAAAKVLVLALFALLWILLACFVTFRGPFLVTGNGYFGSWGGAIMSVFATMSARKD